jgi:hypothetical protein
VLLIDCAINRLCYSAHLSLSLSLSRGAVQEINDEVTEGKKHVHEGKVKLLIDCTINRSTCTRAKWSWLYSRTVLTYTVLIHCTDIHCTTIHCTNTHYTLPSYKVKLAYIDNSSRREQNRKQLIAATILQAWEHCGDNLGTVLTPYILVWYSTVLTPYIYWCTMHHALILHTLNTLSTHTPSTDTPYTHTPSTDTPYTHTPSTDSRAWVRQGTCG